MSRELENICERELKSARSGRAESELGGESGRGDEYENEGRMREGVGVNHLRPCFHHTIPSVWYNVSAKLPPTAPEDGSASTAPLGTCIAGASSSESA